MHTNHVTPVEHGGDGGRGREEDFTTLLWRTTRRVVTGLSLTIGGHLSGRDQPRQSLFVDRSHFVVKAAPRWRPDIPRKRCVSPPPCEKKSHRWRESADAQRSAYAAAPYVRRYPPHKAHAIYNPQKYTSKYELYFLVEIGILTHMCVRRPVRSMPATMMMKSTRMTLMTNKRKRRKRDARGRAVAAVAATGYRIVCSLGRKTGLGSSVKAYRDLQKAGEHISPTKTAKRNHRSSATALARLARRTHRRRRATNASRPPTPPARRVCRGTPTPHAGGATVTDCLCKQQSFYVCT